MSRQESDASGYNGSPTTTTLLRFVTEELKKISSRLDKLERSSSSSETTVPLKLGPYPLRTPQEKYTPEDHSLERVLKAAGQHCILKRWARDWFAKQQHFGWVDSYGTPVRSVERYLVYSWRNACKNNPDLKSRGEREAEKRAYADFAEKGTAKEPVMLPDPPPGPDWKEHQDQIQNMIEQVRKTA